MPPGGDWDRRYEPSDRGRGQGLEGSSVRSERSGDQWRRDDQGQWRRDDQGQWWDTGRRRSRSPPARRRQQSPRRARDEKGRSYRSPGRCRVEGCGWRFICAAESPTGVGFCTRAGCVNNHVAKAQSGRGTSWKVDSAYQGSSSAEWRPAAQSWHEPQPEKKSKRQQKREAQRQWRQDRKDEKKTARVEAQRKELEKYERMQEWEWRSGPVDDKGRDIALPKKMPPSIRKKVEAMGRRDPPITVEASPPKPRTGKKQNQVVKLKRKLQAAEATTAQAEKVARSAGEEAMQVALDARKMLDEAQVALNKQHRVMYQEAMLRTRGRGLLRRHPREASSPLPERPRAPTSSSPTARRAAQSEDTSTPERPKRHKKRSA